MSRWSEAYESHPYKDVWKEIVDAVKGIPADDAVVVESPLELSRCRKVVKYVDGALKGIEPELVPLAFWEQLRGAMSPCLEKVQQFRTAPSLPGLQAVNQDLDVVLSQVRPYLLAKGPLGAALSGAARTYSETIEEAAETLTNDIGVKQKEVAGFHSRVSTLVEQVEDGWSEINEKKRELIGESVEDANSVASKIEELFNSISEYVKQLLEGSDDQPSIKQQVAAAKEEIERNEGAAKQIVSKAQDAVRELEAFHTRIFGVPQEDGSRKEGLKIELDARLKQLTNLEGDAKLRYKALNDHIESLLPGATSAGLASAYGELKSSFSGPIRNANFIFYGAISALVLISLVLTVKSASFTSIEFIQLNNWQEVSRAFAYRLPFLGPLVWLAFYASRRRSEFQRLEQEYAHKEALAKSYDSYRKQILELGKEGDPLMKELLSQTVEAIAHNASKSLDGKHGDKLPYQEILERAAESAAKMKNQQTA